MGHFRDTVKGVGRDRADAEASAVSEFLAENGRRYTIREVESATFVRKVPPEKRVVSTVPIIWNGVRRMAESVEMVPDPAAPSEKWLEEWEFILHTHG